ncbi:MAG: prolipoprotein diacylglyceryl transferase [Planctomycetes bacterium]|nr:prolipoprotein diacylglyceryl transferase [Planctomycetota bacterium]
MRQTLLRIPLEGLWSLGPLGDVPGFGVGLVLLAWLVLGVCWLYQHRRELAFKTETIAPAIVWLVIAAVIVWVSQCVRGIFEQRIEDSKKVVQSTNPQDSEFYVAFSKRDQAWWALRDYETAIATYREEIERNPDFVLPYQSLAWMLATCPEEEYRDGKHAVELAMQAAEKTPFSDAATLDILAAASAEIGDFDNAVKWAKQAADASYGSRPGPSAARLQGIRQRIQLYRNQKPFRDHTAKNAFPASVPVFGYGFMLFLGFVAAGWSAIRRGRMVGLDDTVIWDLSMWILFASILGARMFYLIQYRVKVFAQSETFGDYLRAAVSLPDGGMVLYGGVLMVLIAYFLFCRTRKLSPLLVGDVIMPSFFIGLAFGRIGCLLNGCCYGDRCELPWRIRFPLGSVPDMALVERGFVGAAESVSLSLHPAQIYSSFNALMLAFLTHSYFRIRHTDGAVLALTLLTYPVTRFVIEFLRGDELGKFNTALTISQWVSLGMFSFGLVYLSWLIKRPEKVWSVFSKRSRFKTPKSVFHGGTGVPPVL